MPTTEPSIGAGSEGPKTARIAAWGLATAIVILSLATFRRKIENIMLCGLNRSFCGKLQARTDLKLTVAAAVDSFV
jgi:hypothetical protein